MKRAVLVLSMLALLLSVTAAPALARRPAADPATNPATQPATEQEPAAEPADADGSKKGKKGKPGASAEEREAERQAALIDSVVAAAESYLGLPYLIGREGPDIFDCSGLMFRIFADTGQVERIGSARMRAAGYMRWFGNRGRFVDDIALAERGDLVMYGGGSHIGIYVGDGKVISALVSGVTLHRTEGITVPYSGILKLDWTGEGGAPLPHPAADALPTANDDAETPASLIAPLPWYEPLPDESPDGIAQAGTERPDMRTATSRTFDNGDGTFTTELFSAPIFYLPPETEEWQPIELRFAPTDDPAVLLADRSPISVALADGNAADGFLRLTAGELALALAVPTDAARRRAALPVLGDDGRFADYERLMRRGISMRVFPRADGAKSFVVLADRPAANDLAFELRGEGLTIVAETDGSLSVVQHNAEDPTTEPIVVARIPEPLVLDSSDVTGEGGGVRADAATLTATETDAGWLITVALDEAALQRAVYPLFVDLSITDFPNAAGAAQHTFASSRYPTVGFNGYQRPESPAHAELWHGRLPGTEHYNEAFIRFAALAETLGAVTVESAALRFYPYWQYDLDGPRPTWVSRVAQDWQPRTLSWELRPTIDAELGRFETRAGQWSDIDVSAHVGEVLSGLVADYGFRLHADGGGRGSWKRIVGAGDGAADSLGPRLVVTWSGLRPTAAGVAQQAGDITLSWSQPALAPPVTRWQVEVSADNFATTIATGKARGAAAAEAAWTMAIDELDSTTEYSWRVRTKYGKRTPWNPWSEPATFTLLPQSTVTVRSVSSGSAPLD